MDTLADPVHSALDVGAHGYDFRASVGNLEPNKNSFL